MPSEELDRLLFNECQLTAKALRIYWDHEDRSDDESDVIDAIIDKMIHYWDCNLDGFFRRS